MAGLWHEISLLSVIILSTDLHIGTCNDSVGVILPSEPQGLQSPPMPLEYIFVIDAAWRNDVILSMSRLYNEIMCRSRNITTNINCNIVMVTTNVRSIAGCDCKNHTISEYGKRWVADEAIRGISYNIYEYMEQMPCQLFKNAVEFGLDYIADESVKVVFLGHHQIFHARHCNIDVEKFETSYGVMFTPIQIMSKMSVLNIAPPNFDPISIAASPKVVVGPDIRIPKFESPLSSEDIRNIDYVATASVESAIALGHILDNLLSNYSYVQLTRTNFVEKNGFYITIALEVIGGAVMGLMLSMFIIMSFICVIIGFEMNAASTNEQFRAYYETLSAAQAQLELNRINRFRRENRMPERRSIGPPTPSPLSSPFRVREAHSVTEALQILQEEDEDEVPGAFHVLEQEIRLLNDDRV